MCDQNLIKIKVKFYLPRFEPVTFHSQEQSIPLCQTTFGDIDNQHKFTFQIPHSYILLKINHKTTTHNWHT